MFHDLSGNTVSPVEWLREYADMAAPSNGGDSEDARGLRAIADMLACIRATVTEPQGGDDSGYAEQYDRGHRAACAGVLAILDGAQATPTPTPAVADALARAEAAERVVGMSRDVGDGEAQAIARQIVSVACPDCSAPAGATCRSRHDGGVSLALPHDDRQWAYTRHLLAQTAGDVRALAGQLARAEGERDAWIDTAAQTQRNADYYVGLLDEIGRALGPEAYTADDGGVHDSVIRAKLPDLVRALAGQLARVTGDWFETKEQRDDVRARLAAAERVGEVERVASAIALCCFACERGEQPDAERGKHWNPETRRWYRCGAPWHLHARLAELRTALPARPSTPAAEIHNA